MQKLILRSAIDFAINLFDNLDLIMKTINKAIYLFKIMRLLLQSTLTIEIEIYRCDGSVKMLKLKINHPFSSPEYIKVFHAEWHPNDIQ